MVTEIAEQPATPPVEVAAEQPAVAAVPVVETAAPTTPVAEVTQPVAVAPAAPAPVAPAVPPETQEYIKRLEQLTQTAQVQEDARALERAVAQHAQRLETEQGLTPEQAQAIAKERGDLVYQQYQAEQFRQGQFIAALEIGKELGVDPRILMSLPTPDAMRAAALAATGQNKLAAENATLKAEIDRLKKGSVPAQSFASGAVGGDGGKPTADNYDGLYLKDPERYGAGYRRFLATGQVS